MQKSNQLADLHLARLGRPRPWWHFHRAPLNTKNKAQPRSTREEATAIGKVTQKRSTREVWEQHEANFSNFVPPITTDWLDPSRATTPTTSPHPSFLSSHRPLTVMFFFNWRPQLAWPDSPLTDCSRARPDPADVWPPPALARHSHPRPDCSALSII